jgi:hypothetical protein
MPRRAWLAAFACGSKVLCDYPCPYFALRAKYGHAFQSFVCDALRLAWSIAHELYESAAIKVKRRFSAL